MEIVEINKKKDLRLQKGILVVVIIIIYSYTFYKAHILILKSKVLSIIH